MVQTYPDYLRVQSIPLQFQGFQFSVKLCVHLQGIVVIRELMQNFFLALKRNVKYRLRGITRWNA